MKPETETQTLSEGQSGGGMLTVVAVLGFLLTMVQGMVYYRAKESAKLLGSEKNKVLAMQMAEAGVENNIADIARGTILVHAGQTDTATYQDKVLEGGKFSSQLTTVAVGDSADTVDLTSSGSVGVKTQTIRTRLRLRKHIGPVTTMVPTVTTLDPNTMAVGASNPGWATCQGLPGVNPNCFVCHVPAGNLPGRVVLSQPRSFMSPVHGAHPGDYITTAAIGCSLYNPTVIWSPVTTNQTTVKVQILSWK